LFLKAGLGEVAGGSIEIEMVFDDFSELWSLLLKAQGPFAAFFAKLDDMKKEMVRSRFQRSLRPDSDVESEWMHAPGRSREQDSHAEAVSSQN
jgi:hypothetical protein